MFAERAFAAAYHVGGRRGAKDQMPSRNRLRFTAPSDPTYTAPAYRGFPKTVPPPSDDGREIMPVEPHSLEKHREFGRVMNAFARVAKSYGPTYLDLYAGPGIVRCQGRLHWGSPMLSLQCADPFRRLVFIEDDARSYEALAARAQDHARRAERVAIFNGGAEECLDEALAECPQQGLTLAVVDPFRLDFSLDAVVRLASRLPRLDLLLLFAEDMDLTRNLQQMLADAAQGKRVDAVIGDASWRELYDPAKRDQHTARRVRELYVDRLKNRVGLKFVGEPFQVRNSKNVPLYVLLYATRHELGLKLWTDITKPDQLPLI